MRQGLSLVAEERQLTLYLSAIAGPEILNSLVCDHTDAPGELSYVKSPDHDADPGLDGHIRRRTRNQNGGRTNDGKPSHWDMENDVLDTRELTATGQKSDALGPSPIGWISYSRDGRMMVVVVRSDRKAPAALVPTDSERVSLYSSMLAYAGTYTVDDEKVTHTIDTSWNQAWTATKQVRFYKVDGKTLTLRGAPAKDAVDGMESVYTVIWEKVE